MIDVLNVPDMDDYMRRSRLVARKFPRSSLTCMQGALCLNDLEEWQISISLKCEDEPGRIGMTCRGHSHMLVNPVYRCEYKRWMAG